MKLLLVLLLIVPTTAFAEWNEIQLMLECETTDQQCSDYLYRDGNVAKLKSEPALVLNASNVASARASEDELKMATLSLKLTPEGNSKLEEITRQNIGKILFLVANGKVIQAPRIREKISGGTISLTAGKSNNPSEDRYWEKIPWLMEKISANQSSLEKGNSKALAIYAAITVLLLGSALWFVFRKKKA